jgi:putative phage-type endonuclease
MAKVFVSTMNMDHELWLLTRKKGIGGSDIAALLGLNKKYKSPMNLYLEKIGEAPDSEVYVVDENGAFVSGNEAAYWGNKNEETVAKEFALRTGMKVRRRNAILQHEKYPYFLANVDRLIAGKREGLECKTASEYLKGEWDEESVPDAYFVQCQWYMAITGYKVWHLAVLIGGNKFRHFKIERDDELIQILEERASDFWLNHVVAKVPPAWDGGEASTDLLNALYPEAVDDHIDLPDLYDEKLKRHDELKDQLKELTEEKKGIENEIKGLMEDKKFAFVNGRKCTWSRFSVEKFDKKALQQEHPDIYAKYVSEGSSSKFMIK